MPVAQQLWVSAGGKATSCAGDTRSVLTVTKVLGDLGGDSS